MKFLYFQFAVVGVIDTHTTYPSDYLTIGGIQSITQRYTMVDNFPLTGEKIYLQYQIVAATFTRPADWLGYTLYNWSDLKGAHQSHNMYWEWEEVPDDFVIPSLTANVTGISKTATTRGQLFAASSLFSVSDPAGNAITQYRFFDTGAGGGHFILNGVVQPVGSNITISAAQLGQLQYQAGAGTDTLYVEAFDGYQWGPWSSAFTVSGPGNHAPVVTASNVTLAKGQTLVAASTLFSASDADRDAITQYRFFDTGAGGGHFVLNGVTQPTNTNITITAAQLSQLQYQGGSSLDTLYVQAYDGFDWGSWSNAFTVGPGANRAPVVTGINTNLTPTGLLVTASSLFTASDPDGDAITQYTFWNKGTGGGHFELNGVAQSVGRDIVVSAAQLAQLRYVGVKGTDTLNVKAFDGGAWSAWSPDFTVAVPLSAPTNLELAELSADVYDTSPAGISGDFSWRPFLIGPGLTGADVEFQGVAYKNADGSQVVIAFRGTNFNSGNDTIGLKNVLTDVGSFTSGIPSAGLRAMAQDAAKFLAKAVAQAKAANPNVNITITGHSLGGAVAQLVGKASGFQTTTFNAPGAEGLRSSLSSELSAASNLNSSQKPIVNLHVQGDIVSMFGTQIGTTQTIIPLIAPYAATPANMLNNHLLASSVIPELQQAQTVLQGGLVEPNAWVSSIHFVLDTVATTTPAGLLITTFARAVNAALAEWYDPVAGSVFTFEEAAGSPLVTSLTLLANPQVDRFEVWSKISGSWSAPQWVAAGTAATFGAGTTAFRFVGISASGQAVELPDGYLFNPTFASSGTLNATLTEATNASVVDVAPTVSASNRVLVKGQSSIAAASLVTASVPAGQGITKYGFWDGGIGGGKFLLNGVAQAENQEIDVTAWNLSQLSYQATSTAETLWVRAYDGFQWSAWSQSFTVTAWQQTVPVVTASSRTATSGQNIAASSLFTATDADGDTMTSYSFWNNGTGGGRFVLNGVAQGVGREIVVTAAQLSQLTYQSGTGTDTLWVRASDGTQWSAWSSAFTVAVPQPTLSATASRQATKGQSINVSSLVTISDPGNAGYQQLQLWDSNGTVSGGQFFVNGVAQTGGHEIDVAFANVASTVFKAGTAGGADALWARLLRKDGTLTDWQPFTVTVPTPTLSVSSKANATNGQTINLSSLVTILDPGSVSYQKLELWDSAGTAAGGQFVVNGVAQGSGSISVTPANMSGVVFKAGTQGGADALWARLLQADGTYTAWLQFSVTVPVPTLSVSSKPNATKGQVIGLSNLVTVADPGNVGYQRVELWDSNGTVTGGQFVVNGVAQGGGEVDVPRASVAGTAFDVGTLGGTDTLWARLLLNDGTRTDWQQFAVTAPADRAPTASGSSTSLIKNHGLVSASTLFTASDPDGDTLTRYSVFNTGGGGGRFLLNGVAQTVNQTIGITAAQLAQLQYQGGSGADTLWVQAYDGALWGNWSSSFTVTSGVNAVPVVTAANTAPAALDVAASTLFAASDPDGDPIAMYALKDVTGNGYFVVNGVKQATNTEIDLTPAQLAQTIYHAGSQADSLQIRASDGVQWGNWTNLTVSYTAPASFSFSPLPNNGVYAGGINNSGQISGYTISGITYHGFIYSNGVYTNFDAPGTNTAAYGINNAGQVVGSYTSGGRSHGFLYSAGIFTTLDAPLATSETVATGINSSGQIVGYYTNASGSHGFLYSGGVWQTLDDPLATNGTAAVGINDLGQIVGRYTISNLTHGFLYNAGTYTTIDHPAATVATYANAINNFGQITGWYWDSVGAAFHSFVYSGGNFVTLVNSAAQRYFAEGINDSGQVVGYFQDQVNTPGDAKGFVATPNNLSVSAGATVRISSPYAGLVTFTANTGTIKFDSSNLFAGIVAGMDGNDALDLTDIKFADLPQVTYVGSASGGTLSVSDHTHTATVALKGDYRNAFWVLYNDGSGGTLIYDPPADSDIDIPSGATAAISVPYAGHVSFAAATGTLQLQDSASFVGTVANLTGQDRIDLADIDFASAVLNFHDASELGATLTVSDGTRTASIALLGNYLASSFVASSDGHGGTLVLDSHSANPPLLAQHT